MRIWKWTLPVTDRQTVMIPAGARLMDVQVQPWPPQNDLPQLWALCDESAPPAPRHIAIYGTGNPMPDDPGEYIATFQMRGGSLVFHAFELPQEKLANASRNRRVCSERSERKMRPSLRPC